MRLNINTKLLEYVGDAFASDVNNWCYNAYDNCCYGYSSAAYIDESFTYHYGLKKFDLNTNTYSLIAERAIVEGKTVLIGACYGTIVSPNGKIYSVPGTTDYVFEYDPISGGDVNVVATIHDYGGDYNVAKCAGAVPDEFGNIWLIAARGRFFYKLKFNNILYGFNKKVCASQLFSGR